MTAYIFDTETTGPNPERDQIIEAAWIALPDSVADFSRQHPNKLPSTCQRFKPSVPITVGAQATHHILTSDLAGKPDSGEFALPDDVTYLIGHKVDFDWGMAGKPDVKRICTLALSRHLYPEAGSHTQSAMVYLFARMTGREAEAREALRNAHAALDDVINCGRVLQFLLKKAFSEGYACRNWEDIYMLSEAARIPKVINFGKHKGMAISELPAAYKTWLSAQDGIDPYLLKALTM
jgi:exodeoxyribonuclease X